MSGTNVSNETNCNKVKNPNWQQANLPEVVSLAYELFRDNYM